MLHYLSGGFVHGDRGAIQGDIFAYKGNCLSDAARVPIAETDHVLTPSESNSSPANAISLGLVR